MGVPQKSRSLFLPLPSPLAFSSAPRRGERRRGRGGEEPRRGDEREWRPLLWWGPGQRAAGRTRSGFSSRGLAFSFAFWWGFSSSSSLSRAAVRCERGISARLPARPPAVWTADWGCPWRETCGGAREAGLEPGFGISETLWAWFCISAELGRKGIKERECVGFPQ